MKRAFLFLAVVAACFGLVRADVTPRPGPVQTAPMQFVYPPPVDPWKDLYSYYKLEEASGTRVDSFGSRHLGAYNAPPNTTGKNNLALLGSLGKGAYLSTGFGIWNSAWTTAGWVSFSSSTVENCIVWGTSTGGIKAIVRSGLRFGMYLDTSYYGSQDFATDTFYHVVMRFTPPTTYELFVDGDLYLTRSATVTAASDLVVAAPGMITGTETIDELALFDAAIPNDQIAALFNDGTGVFY